MKTHSYRQRTLCKLLAGAAFAATITVAANQQKTVWPSPNWPSAQPAAAGLQREDHKLMSVKEYENFILRFEFKIGRRANSGVAIRAPLEGNAAFLAMEIQIIDNHNWKGLKTWQKHGSIYGVVAAKTGHLKPPGEWNTEEIICQGSKVKVIFNGAVIIDAEVQDLGVKTLDETEHPGLERTKGHIGFLPHPRSSEYRNVRIMEL